MRTTALKPQGINKCIFCGATNPDSEDLCPNTGGRHTLVSAADKEVMGQGYGPGPSREPGEQGYNPNSISYDPEEGEPIDGKEAAYYHDHSGIPAGEPFDSEDEAENRIIDTHYFKSRHRRPRLPYVGEDFELKGGRPYMGEEIDLGAGQVYHPNTGLSHKGAVSRHRWDSAEPRDRERTCVNCGVKASRYGNGRDSYWGYLWPTEETEEFPGKVPPCPGGRKQASRHVAHGFDPSDDTEARHCPFCFSGATRILTYDGIVRLDEVVGTRQRVLTNKGFDRKSGYWVEAEIKDFGEQPLWEVVLTRNKISKTIYATAEHVWFLQSSQGGTWRDDRGQWHSHNIRNVHRKEITRYLTKGHRLAYLLASPQVSDATPLPAQAIARGICFGDGMTPGLRRVTTECSLWGGKDAQLLKYFAEALPLLETEPIRTLGGADGLKVKGIPAAWKQRPSLEEPTEVLYGWLAGYFAADGNVGKNGQVVVDSSVRSNLEFVQAVCNRLGISYFGISQKMRRGCSGRGILHDTNLDRHGSCALETPTPLFRMGLVTSTLPRSFFLVQAHRDRVRRDLKYERLGWTVRSVRQSARVERVYCPVVPDSHSFALEDNIWTHNCGSGQIWGRSDGDIECEFCNRTFSILAQPAYPQMAQNLDGTPMDIEGQIPDAGGVADQGANNPYLDAPTNEEGDEEGSPADEEDQGKNGSIVARSAKQAPRTFFFTHQGNVLDRSDMINYLALRQSPLVITDVRAYNEARH